MAFTNICQYFFLVSLLVMYFWAIHALCRPIGEQLIMLKMHQQWMAQHGLVYADEAEKQRRHKIFKDNVKYIENFNNGVGKDRGYKLAVNKFADLTNDEFRSM